MIESRVTRTEIVSEAGLCVAGSEAGARAGARLLAAGGNAVDAVVAAAFVAYVVEPWNCGPGGYGHLALHFAPAGEFVTIDHYVRAPAAARPDMYELDPGSSETYYGWPETLGRRNVIGALACAVPGAVAGLCLAHERYGVLPLPEVLAPAIEEADSGLLVTWELLYRIAGRTEELQAQPHAAELLLPDGHPPAFESRLDLSALGQTLRLIADRGPSGFYDGPVAAAIERTVSAQGGILTSTDLAAYRARLLHERPKRYRGLEYVTAFDQVSYEALNILACFDLPALDHEGVEYRHLVAEALAHAYVDNMTHYGDPEVVGSPVDALASEEFARTRAETIQRTRAAPRPVAAADPWPYARSHVEASVGGVSGTSQVVTADRDGSMAALCTSISADFGSCVLVPGTGVFLNNGMGNFDPRPDRMNAIAPGKMPIFAAPALVAARNGRAVFAASGSGGYRITTAVLHTLSGVVDAGRGVQEAAEAPRVHCQGRETFVDARIPAAVVDGLAALGHDVVVQAAQPAVTHPFGRVCAILRDADGACRSGSDPAATTAAAGL